CVTLACERGMPSACALLAQYSEGAGIGPHTKLLARACALGESASCDALYTYQFACRDFLAGVPRSYLKGCSHGSRRACRSLILPEVMLDIGGRDPSPHLKSLSERPQGCETGRDGDCAQVPWLRRSCRELTETNVRALIQPRWTPKTGQ